MTKILKCDWCNDTIYILDPVKGTHRLHGWSILGEGKVMCLECRLYRLEKLLFKDNQEENA